jgi:hypothetical protein
MANISAQVLRRVGVQKTASLLYCTDKKDKSISPYLKVLMILLDTLEVGFLNKLYTIYYDLAILEVNTSGFAGCTVLWYALT